jgi:hypothetical protein
MTRRTWLELHPVPTTLALIAALIVIFLIAYSASGASKPKEAEPPPWVPSKWDDHIDDLERQALDDAFKKHIGQLYSIWVTDNYQPRIPPKALTGARNARDAYIRSMEGIEKRQQPPR